MRLMGYVRVSTEDQARGGHSLDAQRARLRAYAEAQDHELVTIHADEGVSGRRHWQSRVALMAAVAAIHAKEADGLLVLKIDRLSRQVKDVLEIAAEAKRKRWHLMSVHDHIDTSTATGRFVLVLLANLAEMESGLTGERVAMGMSELRVQKRVMSYKTPFGWRMPDGSWRPLTRDRDRSNNPTGDSDGRQMVVYPPEQEMLAEIMAMVADGMTPCRVAGALNRAKRYSPRTGKPWQGNSVACIVKTANKYADIAPVGEGKSAP